MNEAANQPIMHPEALWSLADVAVYFRCQETHARKLSAQPDFPRPVRFLGDRSYPRWFAGEVWAWAKDQRAA